MVGDWSSGMIPASGAGGRGFDSRITPPCFFFLAFGIVSKKTLAGLSMDRRLLSYRYTSLVSSVRQSVRLLIDWPRVRSPHRVLFLIYFFVPWLTSKDEELKWQDTSTLGRAVKALA